MGFSLQTTITGVKVVLGDTSDARLSEDAAHRLLARAVELDASRDAAVTLTQLRDAAQEAGISVAAFEAALAEMHQERVHRDVHPIAPMRGLSARIRSWLGLGEPATPSPSRQESLTRNLVALAAFWGILTFLVAIGRVADVEWLVRKATDPVALALGAAVAARLRARPIGVLLAGLAISQGAEFVMDAALGVPAVHGFGSHIALMIAGVAGVMLGGWLLRPPPSGEVVTERALASPVDVPAKAAPPSEQRRALVLRFHPV